MPTFSLGKRSLCVVIVLLCTMGVLPHGMAQQSTVPLPSGAPSAPAAVPSPAFPPSGGGPAVSPPGLPSGVPSPGMVLPGATPGVSPAPTGIPGVVPTVPGQSIPGRPPFPTVTPTPGSPLGPTPTIPGPSPTTIPGGPVAPLPGTPGVFPPAAPQPGQVPPGAGEAGGQVPGAVPGPDASMLTEPLSPIEQVLAGRTLEQDAVALRQFGYDLFTRVPTTFAPVTDVPVGAEYVIGPGDGLNILLWGAVQENYQVEVDRNGAISLPRVGLIPVWGLTLDQLQRLMQQRLAEFYPDFRMAVTLGKLRTLLVYMVGEVRQPGAYTVSSLSTIINALFASGGPTKNGSLRQMRLIRQGRHVHTLDLYSFLLYGDKSQDWSLQSGDTILVPLLGAVAGVTGNVKRPAIYEVAPGTTLQQLLDLTGGVTPLGYLQRVQVERVVANEKKIVVDIDLSRPQKKPTMASLWQTRMADRDLVRVLPINPILENIVTLEGHVLRPGRYELKPGMRLRDVLPSYKDLLPEPFLDYVEIVRYTEPDLQRVLLPVNLRALLAGDATQNLPLRPQDTIRVFAKSAYVDAPELRISGLVHLPGSYLLTEGTRVSDLVLRAGNVQKFAYLEKAELTRHLLGQSGDTVIRIEINLAKALAGDREHDILLQDLDQLVVRRISDIDLNRTVEVVGEVRFPGIYPIQKSERLSSLLQRAGGFAPEAYLRGVTFTRPSVKADQTRRLQQLIREEEQALLIQTAAEVQGALTIEEVQSQRQFLESRRQLLERLKTVEPDGRVVIRLRPLEEFAGSDQDIELGAGDRLAIPETPKYVNVIGEVYTRTSLLYEPNKNVGYYLEKVGGLRPEADEDQIYIFQSDGTVVSNSQEQFAVLLTSGQTMRFKDFFAVQLQPGDSIVVPRLTKAPTVIRDVRDIVQILFQSATLIGVLASLF